MAKASGGTRADLSYKERLTEESSDRYWRLAKQIKQEVLESKSYLNNNPISRPFDNVISGTFLLTWSDVKKVLGKNTSDNEFNAIKNELARDIEHLIDRGHYEGWSPPDPGHHEEAICFSYYSHETSQTAYVVFKKMHDGGMWKIHSIMNKHMFDYRVSQKEIKKGLPPT